MHACCPYYLPVMFRCREDDVHVCVRVRWCRGVGVSVRVYEWMGKQPATHVPQILSVLSCVHVFTACSHVRELCVCVGFKVVVDAGVVVGVVRLGGGGT